MKKWLAILVSLSILFVGLPAMAAQEVDLSGKLVIVHTNDVHGYAVTDPSEPSVGYAQIKQYKADVAALGANVLLLDAGDASQGQPIVNLDKGVNAIALAFENELNLTEIALFVEQEKGVNKEDLIQYLRDKMPAYMIPSKFFFLPIFALNSNDKVDRIQLQKMLK